MCVIAHLTDVIHALNCMTTGRLLLFLMYSFFVKEVGFELCMNLILRGYFASHVLDYDSHSVQLRSCSSIIN